LVDEEISNSEVTPFRVNGLTDRFHDYLDHPVLINHQTWSGTTVTSTVSTNLVALYLSSAPAQIKNKLKNLLYFRAKIKIKIVVQGQAQAFGQLVYTFVPKLLDAARIPDYQIKKTVVLQNYCNCKIVPHITLDPSKTATYELELPIPNPTGFYSFDTTYCQGSYQFDSILLNPLGSGTAVASTANICTYMSFTDVSFDGLTNVAMTSNPFKEEKGPYSTLADSAASFAGTVGSTFPVLSPFTNLFSTVSSKIGIVLKALGYAKPPVVEPTYIGLTRTCDSYSQTDGKNSAIVLAKSQMTTMALAPEFAQGTFRDMDVAYVSSLPGLMVIGSIPTTAAAEALLFGLPVSPLCSRNTGSGFEPTPCAGLAVCHSAWRGDSVYTFEFVASIFHRATVLIAWDPHNSTTAPTLAEALVNLENVTVNISGNTTVEVTFPFKQPKPACRSGYFIDPLGSSFLESNGIVYMFVVNPVLTNGSTDGIQFNIYSSMKNAKYICPSSSYIANQAVLMTSSPFMVESTSVAFGTSQGNEFIGYSCFPDVSNSVKDITARHTLFASFAKTSAAGLNLGTGNSVFPKNSSDSAVVTSLYAWIASAYLGVRGSNSWSYFPYQLTAPVYTPIVSRVTHHTHASSTAAPTCSATQNPAFTGAYAWSQPLLAVTSRVDAVAPIMSAQHFVSMRSSYINCYDRLEFLTDFPSGGAENINVELFVASGDDVTFGWFLGFPRVGT